MKNYLTQLMKVALAIILISVASAVLKAQSIHFTQFDVSNQQINPSLAGAFEGTLRANGIYRDQFRKVLAAPYKTALIQVDAPLFFIGSSEKLWLGAGAVLYNDRAGLTNLTTNAVKLSGALHYSLDPSFRNVITLGLQGGMMNRNNDLAGAGIHFEDELMPSVGFGDPSSVDRTKYAGSFTHPELAVGLLWKSKMNEKTNLQLGASVGHLNRPKMSFASNDVKLNRIYIAHATLRRQLSDKLMLAPKLFFVQQGKANQFQGQLHAAYRLQPELNLTGGLGMRATDALQFFAGVNINDLKFGLSYDYTIAGLSSDPYSGGAIELAVSYIWRKVKHIDVKPVIFCPQL